LNANDPRAIPDALFLNAQNWQTTARIIGPLRALGIAAAAVVDIDLLLEAKSEGFQNLMESAGMPPASRTGCRSIARTTSQVTQANRRQIKESRHVVFEWLG